MIRYACVALVPFLLAGGAVAQSQAIVVSGDVRQPGVSPPLFARALNTAGRPDG